MHPRARVAPGELSANEMEELMHLNPKLKDSFFFSYKAEGVTHARRRNYEKAILSYTKALTIRQEKGALNARGRCYLQLGNTTKAIEDAEAAIAANPATCHKDLQLKADALFAAGEFEFALVNYFRALHLRPDFTECNFGITKCQESIAKCFGVLDPRSPVKDGLRVLTKAGASPFGGVFSRLLRHLCAGWRARHVLPRM
eukprot:jgi/Mesvir1/29482/Mv06407-RA.1